MLERHRVGGKKNEATIIIGIDGDKIVWADSFAFAKSKGNAMMNVQMRDQLQTLGTIANADVAVGVIEKVIAQNYRRPEMAEYKYLRDEIQLTTGGMWAIFITQLIVLIGLTIVMHREDIFGEERFRSYSNRWRR